MELTLGDLIIIKGRTNDSTLSTGVDQQNHAQNFLLEVFVMQGFCCDSKSVTKKCFGVR